MPNACLLTGAWQQAPLQHFRIEFAVDDAGPDFHLRAHGGYAADEFAALIGRDAVAAAEGRVGAEHAQDCFDLAKTMARVF